MSKGRVKKRKVWSVDVTATKEELFSGIEADSEEDAEKQALELFKDSYGGYDKFDSIDAVADEDEE